MITPSRLLIHQYLLALLFYIQSFPYKAPFPFRLHIYPQSEPTKQTKIKVLIYQHARQVYQDVVNVATRTFSKKLLVDVLFRATCPSPLLQPVQLFIKQYLLLSFFYAPNLIAIIKLTDMLYNHIFILG